MQTEQTKLTKKWIILSTILVAAMSLFFSTHLFKRRLLAWYCHSQVMINVKMQSVFCFQWSNIWKSHLTEIRCSKGKNGQTSLPNEWTLFLHSKPEFTQCLNWKPQPKSGVARHLNELVLFCRAEICRCCRLNMNKFDNNLFK